MRDYSMRSINCITYYTDVTFVFKCRAPKGLSKPRFGIGVHTTDFVYLASTDTIDTMSIPKMSPGEHEIRCRIKHFPFYPGVYGLRLGISAGETATLVFYADNAFLFRVVPSGNKRTRAMYEGLVEWQSEWSGLIPSRPTTTSAAELQPQQVG